MTSIKPLTWLSSLLLAGVLFIHDPQEIKAQAALELPSRSDMLFNFERIEDMTIASNAGYVAFPDIARLPNNQLMVVFRTGEGHVEPQGRLMKQFGTPDGRFWTTPEVLFDEPNIDDRDPSITVLKNGKVMVSFFQWMPPTSTAPIIAHPFVLISEDYGRTFSRPIQVDHGPMVLVGARLNERNEWVDRQNSPVYSHYVSSPIKELSDRLVLPAYGGRALASKCNDHWRIVFFESFDEGRSWKPRIINKDVMPHYFLSEPDFVDVGNNKLVMHIRSVDNYCNYHLPGKMKQAVSLDNGYTWSPWKDFDFQGHAPNIYKMSNGILVSAYRWLDNQMSNMRVDFIHSEDEGETWSKPQTVAHISGDGAYPSMLELEDNKLMIIYYTDNAARIAATNYLVKPRSFDLIASGNIDDNQGHKFEIFPNPGKGEFNFSGTLSAFGEPIKITVMNAAGMHVYQDLATTTGNGAFSGRLNLGHLPNGLYHVHIGNEHQMVKKKIFLSK